MSKADDDAAKWMEANAKWQRRELYKAKETGTPYYINAQGDVITYDPEVARDTLIDIAKQLQEKMDEKAKEVVFGIKPTPNK